MQSEIEMVKSEPKGRIDMENGKTLTKERGNYIGCGHLQRVNAGNLGLINICGCEGSECFGYTFWTEGCPGCNKYELRGSQEGDAISHPAHYCAGREYKPVKVIQDWGLSFCLGNALKYIARAGRKDGCDKREDLQKAVKYLEFEMQAEEKGAEDAAKE